MPRTPIRLENALRETLKEFGLEKKARTYEVLVNWEEIVGVRIAAVTKPEKLEHGVLHVRVLDSVWKYELNARKSEVLAKVQQAYPGVVTAISWR